MQQAHLGKQRCPAPQADHGQQEAGAGQHQAQAQHERGQQGVPGSPGAPSTPLVRRVAMGPGAVPALTGPHPWAQRDPGGGKHRQANLAGEGPESRAGAGLAGVGWGDGQSGHCW